MAEPALAQAKNPFSVGISEGGGPATGAMGWILAQQGWFERALSAAVRAVRTDGTALPWLAALSFAYGVLHAAGPGHGKAVLASYMVANRRALRRGIALSFLAALLQAAVAVALVGVLSLAFRATATGMREGAALIETASYVGVAALGLWLTWRKGAALPSRGLARPPPRPAPSPTPSPPRWPPPPRAGLRGRRGQPPGARLPARRPGLRGPRGRPGRSRLRLHGRGGRRPHLHGPGCGHVHAPDPATLGDGFSWRDAVATVVAAGARPCSGAILVLVFSLAQGVFLAGVASTVVMALGTAITTAALAATAVLAKGVALRLGAPAWRDAARPSAARWWRAGWNSPRRCWCWRSGCRCCSGVGPLQGLA